MGHLFRFAARFSRLLEIGAALHKKKPSVTDVRLKTVRAGWVATGAAGFSALVALSLFAVSLGTAGIDDNVVSAHTPACPSSIPTAGGEYFWTDSNDDRWFTVRQTLDSGHTIIRAYVASSLYDAGYVPTSPHETCILRVRGPDDDEDLDPPVQIFIRPDEEDSSDANTEETQQPSATFLLLQAPGNSETSGLATVGAATFTYEGTAVIIAIVLSHLESDSDSQTVDYRFRVRVIQGQIINLLCQGSGMNLIRELTTNAGASIQTATIPGTCPVGTYTIVVELADGDDSTISNPISEGTGYLVIGPLPKSQQSGQGGSGQGGSGQGGSGQGGSGQGGSGQGGSGQGGSGQGGSGQGGSGQGAAAASGAAAARAAAARAAAARAAAARAAAARAAAARAAAARAATARAATARAATARGRQRPAGRQRPGRQRPGRQRPGRQRPGRQRPGRQRPGRQRPRRRQRRQRPGRQRQRRHYRGYCQRVR